MAWQSLNFVVGRRELVGPFTPRQVAGTPLSSPAELEHYLRYSAGVELAVAQQYLTAAYSLKPHAGLPPGLLRDDVRAAHAELMRIAIGEMRHLRAVNEVLRALLPAGTAFSPALRVADRLPADLPGTFRRSPTGRHRTSDRNSSIRSAFGLGRRVYARIRHARTDGPRGGASVRTIMAEGDHFETFRSIQLAWQAQRAAVPARHRGAPPSGDADRRNCRRAISTSSNNPCRLYARRCRRSAGSEHGTHGHGGTAGRRGALNRRPRLPRHLRHLADPGRADLHRPDAPLRRRNHRSRSRRVTRGTAVGARGCTS